METYTVELTKKAGRFGPGRQGLINKSKVHDWEIGEEAPAVKMLNVVFGRNMQQVLNINLKLLED